MRYLSTRKDKKKFFRGIIQGIILIFLAWIILNTIFDFQKYTHFEDKDVSEEDKGFIAISYIAVDRDEKENIISSERLDEHFSALNKNGYTTINQDDIEKYYNKDKNLPEKSMFLMFEDGRRDTAIFAGALLEKYNFIGTILSYGDRLNKKDLKFLGTKDFKSLEKSSFWELGTNGYRLSYINVYDRYDNFLGELSYLEYAALSDFFKRKYNHYLMDFIRDEDRVPKESYEEMEKRISRDYELMDKVYKEELGKLPSLYAIMHANTGAFGTNKKASDINEEHIKKLFTINFNREGYSLNNRESSIYELTRMQAQAYWYPNHLLMRIKDDTKEDVEFVYGDLKKKKDWNILNGVAEYKESSIVLTSEPGGKGLIRLKPSKEYRNYRLSTRITGNKLGNQSIYLRADENLNKYIAVRVKSNVLYIEENGEVIYELDLDKHDGIVPKSLEEDEYLILKESFKIYQKHSNMKNDPTKMEYQKEVEDREFKTPVEEGEEYIPEIEINERGDRKLEIDLKDNKISVKIDDKEAARDISLSENSSGYIYLESNWGESVYSQRNIVDNVYDGVFEDLIIKDISNNKKVLYKNKLEGFNKFKSKALSGWNNIISWFINNL